MTAEWAWVAGLYEGEGSLVIRRDRSCSHLSMEISITSTDEDVVDKLVGIVQCGKKYGPYQYGNKKPYWKWSCHNQPDISYILFHIASMLGERRIDKVNEALGAMTDRANQPHYLVSRKGMGGYPTQKRVGD